MLRFPGIPVAVLVGFHVLAAQAADGDVAPFTVTRLPLQQTPVKPVIFRATAPGRIFVDFGRAAFAGLELRVKHPDPGRRLVVHLGETLSAPDTVHRTPGGSIRYHRAGIELKAGQEVYVVPLTPADARLMPLAIGPVMPFRYVEIEQAPATLTADDVRQLMAHYPFDDSAARFECSDEKLNAIWSLCHHTMKATSFAAVFVDGDRERKPYEADAYINQLGWYACTTDWTLPRHTHEYLIHHPTWPTEWILFSPLMAWADYLHTGDATSLRAFYPNLQARTLLALARPDGLISTVEPPVPEAVSRRIRIAKIRDIVDWPAGERDGFDLRPINTVVNAFHAHALERMSRIARVLGLEADARQYAAASARTAAALNANLVDPATGLYVDGEGSAHSSLHANLFPLAFGLVPPERRARVTAFVRSRGMACSVYAAQFLLEALFDHGEAEQAIALMTADNDRSWTHMIERVGTTMALEAWDNKYKPNQDWNHAWGAAPASVLPGRLMGVQAMEPGWRRIAIRPRPGGLSWAEARVPTPRGPVDLRFEQTGGFTLAVTVPPDAEATVTLPRSPALPAGPCEVKMNGKEVAARETPEGWIVERVPAGRHRFELHAPAAKP